MGAAGWERREGWTDGRRAYWGWRRRPVVTVVDESMDRSIDTRIDLYTHTHPHSHTPSGLFRAAAPVPRAAARENSVWAPLVNKPYTVPKTQAAYDSAFYLIKGCVWGGLFVAPYGSMVNQSTDTRLSLRGGLDDRLWVILIPPPPPHQPPTKQPRRSRLT